MQDNNFVKLRHDNHGGVFKSLFILALCFNESRDCKKITFLMKTLDCLFKQKGDLRKRGLTAAFHGNELEKIEVAL